jgi:hypothetical protein
MKILLENFTKKFRDNSIFHLDRTLLVTTLHNGINTVCCCYDTSLIDFRPAEKQVRLQYSTSFSRRCPKRYLATHCCSLHITEFSRLLSGSLGLASTDFDHVRTRIFLSSRNSRTDSQNNVCSYLKEFQICSVKYTFCFRLFCG